MFGIGFVKTKISITFFKKSDFNKRKLTLNTLLQIFGFRILKRIITIIFLQLSFLYYFRKGKLFVQIVFGL